jgi:hypothetical protein
VNTICYDSYYPWAEVASGLAHFTCWLANMSKHLKLCCVQRPLCLVDACGGCQGGATPPVADFTLQSKPTLCGTPMLILVAGVLTTYVRCM